MRIIVNTQTRAIKNHGSLSSQLQKHCFRLMIFLRDPSDGLIIALLQYAKSLKYFATIVPLKLFLANIYLWMELYIQ